MESLSPDCTSLKHRYDSCFNLWFEGYLQPALDGQSSASLTLAADPVASQSPISSPTTDYSTPFAPTNLDKQEPRHRPVTNWSNVFPDQRQGPVASIDRPAGQSSQADYTNHMVNLATVDPKGKTRAQIKAEEYERSCGEAWKSYQSCLTRAIKNNESLSTLLEQARSEHPLRNQDHLAGTAWDPKADFSAAS